MGRKIILASQSLRRQSILTEAGISFEVVVSHAKEEYPSSLSPQEVSVFIATHKAYTTQQLLLEENRGDAGSVILAADTIVYAPPEILGKPKDRADAIHMLEKLSNRTHQVITGVVLLYDDNIKTFCATTEVSFLPLTTEQISYYVDNYQPYDKSGSYGVQEWIGMVGIASIKGDYYNIMGLPISLIYPTIKLLL